MKNLSIYLISIAVFITGCDKIKIENSSSTKTDDVVTVKIDDAIVKEAKSLSQDDRDYAMKQFFGLSMYIKNSQIESSMKIDSLIASVQKDYNWTREKNKTFTDVVYSFLKNNEYKPAKFDSKEVREKYSNIFFILASSIKQADIEVQKEKVK